jgi:hypothetical protein
MIQTFNVAGVHGMYFGHYHEHCRIDSISRWPGACGRPTFSSKDGLGASN